jgi:BON domain
MTPGSGDTQAAEKPTVGFWVSPFHLSGKAEVQIYKENEMAALAKMAAVGIGSAVIAYLFDPERGKGRRARLGDQTRSRFRKVQDATRQQMKYQSNRLKGLAHELKSDGPPADLGDDLIRQKIKSEVIGPAQVANVEIDVRNGVVTISGDLEDAQYDRLARDIAKVPGVESVDQSQGASASGNNT